MLTEVFSISESLTAYREQACCSYIEHYIAIKLSWSLDLRFELNNAVDAVKWVFSNNKFAMLVWTAFNYEQL